MSDAQAGYKAIMKLSTASGQGLAKIAELRDYTLRMQHAPVNATSHDSSGDRELIAGTGMWSASADILWVQSSTTHQPLYDVLAGRTEVDVEFIETGSSSDGYLSGSGYVSEWSLGAPNEDAVNAGISFEGDGSLTRNSSA